MGAEDSRKGRGSGVNSRLFSSWEQQNMVVTVGALESSGSRVRAD